MVENPATQSEPVQPSAASNPNVVKPNFNKRLAHSNDRGPPLANQIGENHGRKKTNPTNGKSQGTWRGLAPFYRLLFFGFGTFFSCFFFFSSRRTVEQPGPTRSHSGGGLWPVNRGGKRK